MAPRLYTASVVGEGVPVDEIEHVENVKKPRQKKEKSVEPDDGASRRAPKPEPEDGANVSTEGKPDKENKEEKKEKKPRTEKQIAAAERMVEARRLKKEQREKEAAEALAKAEEEKKKAADKEAAKEAKKEAAKEKRRQSKLLKATANTTANGVAVSEDHPMEDVQTPEKPQKRKSNDDAPPKWLPTLISAIKSETGHTGSIKKLKEEAHAEAAEKWSDPLVRDRVNVIHNKAGEQVTNAIFPGRTFVRR